MDILATPLQLANAFWCMPSTRFVLHGKINPQALFAYLGNANITSDVKIALVDRVLHEFREGKIPEDSRVHKALELSVHVEAALRGVRKRWSIMHHEDPSEEQVRMAVVPFIMQELDPINKSWVVPQLQHGAQGTFLLIDTSRGHFSLYPEVVMIDLCLLLPHLKDFQAALQELRGHLKTQVATQKEELKLAVKVATKRAAKTQPLTAALAVITDLLAVSPT
jgi:hypothetical protein